MHLEKSKYSYFKWRLPPKTKLISGGRIVYPGIFSKAGMLSSRTVDFILLEV